MVSGTSLSVGMAADGRHLVPTAWDDGLDKCHRVEGSPPSTQIIDYG